MFRLGTVKDLEPLFRPELQFMRLSYEPPSWTASVLKVLGGSFLYSQCLQAKAKRVLEFGHGDVSPLFELLGRSCETWGIEESNEAFSQEQMLRFRTHNSSNFGTKFFNGLLGDPKIRLPKDHFDVVCSASVVEHIPYHSLLDVTKAAFAALRPGGLFVNSFDIPQSYPQAGIDHMFNCHQEAGFKWVEQATPQLDWNAANVCFEDPRIVLFWYMHYLPTEKLMTSWPGNFASVLMAARKPE
jgi:SAM-dependent methyltransferase